MHLLKYTFFAATSVALVSAAACSSSETTPAGTTSDASTEAASTKDTGTNTDPDSGTPSACKLSEPVSSQKACNDCAEENCCEDVNACVDDKDCTDFLQCAVACLDDAGVPLDGAVIDAGGAKACTQACQTAHKSGAALYATFSQCVQGSCKSVCTN